MVKFKCPKCQKFYNIENVDFNKWKCECGYKPTPVDIKLDFKKQVDGNIQVIHKKIFTKTKEELFEEIKEGIKKNEDDIIFHEEEIKRRKDEIEILHKRRERLERI